jgi:zinc protease
MRLLIAAGLAVALAGPARAEISIQEVVSPGGIRAWLYEDHSIPMLNIEARFRGGSALDPAGKEGAVGLMAQLLGQGAGDLDATGFAEAREALAARLGFRAGRDSVRVSAQMLSETRAETLDLLRLALSEPRFDPEPLERLRRQRLSGLRADETDPGALARRAFREAMFAGHPYARPGEGTPETMAALDAPALRAAHAATLARDRLQVAVVGDIGAAELAPLLDLVFGDLPATGAPLPDAAEVRSARRVIRVDLDIPQTVVLFGQAGLAREDDDFVAASVMNHILGGGGFASRLMQEVRERRGLSYGISTWLASDDLASLVMGRFSTGNARAAEALDVVRAEWRRMAEEGVDEAELAAAKRYLTGAYPLRFDGNGRIAAQLIQMQIDGRPIDFVNRRNSLVQAVTVADIARVANRLLQTEALTVVLVGRPIDIESEASAVNH